MTPTEYFELRQQFSDPHVLQVSRLNPLQFQIQAARVQELAKNDPERAEHEGTILINGLELSICRRYLDSHGQAAVASLAARTGVPPSKLTLVHALASFESQISFQLQDQLGLPDCQSYLDHFGYQALVEFIISLGEFFLETVPYATISPGTG